MKITKSIVNFLKGKKSLKKDKKFHREIDEDVNKFVQKIEGSQIENSSKGTPINKRTSFTERHLAVTGTMKLLNIL